MVLYRSAPNYDPHHHRPAAIPTTGLPAPVRYPAAVGANGYFSVTDQDADGDAYAPAHKNTHGDGDEGAGVGDVFANGDEIMFDHKHYRNQFLMDYKEGKFRNNSVAQVARSSASPRFQIIGVHHLTAAENVGNHNLYLDIIDINGKRMRNRIEWGWMGQRPDEIVRPVELDKPLSEPSGNIAMGARQVVWAKVLDRASDAISGVTTLLPDEGPGNTIGHHSYYVVWLWVEGGVEPSPPTTDWEKKYKALVDNLKALADSL